MLPKDFVFNSVYKEAKKRGGASEVYAHQRATMALQKFLKGKFQGKAVNFIEAEIKEAVRLTKLSKPKGKR